MEAIQNRFLWGGTDNKRVYHLVKWEEVQFPMKLGGLGIRSITTINKAFHGKWIWRYLKDDNSLWRRIVELKLMKKNSEGRFIFPKRLHWISVWKGILSSYNDLIANTHWRVGWGNEINFWHDSWCEEGNLKSVFPSIYVIAQQKNMLVSEAFDRLGHCCIAVNRNLNDWELEDFEKFLSLMARVHLSDSPDTLVWKLKKNGKSSINSF